MKKVLCLSVLLLSISSVSVFAESTVDPLETAREFYSEAVETSLEKMDAEIKQDEIYIVEIIYFGGNIDKMDPNVHSSEYAVVIPDALTDDTYTFWFNKDRLSGDKGHKNFPSFKTLDFSRAEMEEYLAQNGLSTPSMVTVMMQPGRMIYAYYVRYDDMSYIIPFAKIQDYYFDVLGDEVLLEFGKAYTKEEYYEVYVEDLRLYGEYRIELEKELSSGTFDEYIVNGAEVIIYNDEDGNKHQVTYEEKEEIIKKQDEKETEKKKDTNIPDDEEQIEEDDEEADVPTPKPTKKESEENKEITLKTDEIIFFDVPANHYAYSEINEFSKQGIVNGYGNGYFGAEDSITYEHFGLLLDRLLDYTPDNTDASPAVREDIIVSVVKALGIDVSASDEKIIAENFTDCDNIRDENKKYIAGAIENGIVVGSDGKLFPDKELTRAETVVLLQRAVNYNR